MIRVVIFDDNDDLRQTLTSFLSSDESIEVVGSFPNARQVEENIMATDPDVVLMDIDMPLINGIEGVRRLRKTTSKAQVMMLTVFENEENILDALKAGANGYLLKNTPPARLLEAIKELHEGGAPMSGVIAKKMLQIFLPPSSAVKPKEQLTPREKEILDLLVKGNSYKMIAAQFNISPHTVRNHIHRIYEKLHVTSATEAAYKAFNS